MYGDGVWNSRKTLERSERLPSDSLFQAFRSWGRRKEIPRRTPLSERLEKASRVSDNEVINFEEMRTLLRFSRFLAQNSKWPPMKTNVIPRMDKLTAELSSL